MNMMLAIPPVGLYAGDAMPEGRLKETDWAGDW